MLSYVLAYCQPTIPHQRIAIANKRNRDITDDVSKIKSSTSIVLISVSIVLVTAFFLWVNFRERRGLPALISNSLWSNGAFGSVCTNIFLIVGAFTAFQQVTNFFFQEVQGISAFQTAWRFLPLTLSGTLTSIVTGSILHCARADWIVSVTTIVSCLSPLLMALVDPAWSYWVFAFPAVLLSPITADSVFTVSNVVITSVFPAEMQGLAGGVFNTVSQIGKAVGLALVTLISNVVTVNSDFDDKGSPEALMLGYRVTFWFLVVVNIVSLVVSALGLRKVENIGRERKL
jgi:Na+/melibiose symporter-like transporter